MDLGWQKKILHGYFRTTLLKEVIGEECARFLTTSQRLADQVREIIKKVWLFYLWLLEIHQQTNRESGQEDLNKTINKPNGEKHGHSKRNETQSNNDRKTTHPDHTEETLIQEEKRI